MSQNSLIHETSPYLLQHASNPVQWHAWNDDALQKAKDENKPIFLSIGYSSCHWCHVMAHESFENEDVAKFMNENFVNIKVDREERPDIDDIYQKACQMTTGQGGWPLSAFLTPDQRPFYVGTYFPVLDSHGRPGFGSVCRQLAQAWKERPQDVVKSAGDFVESMRKADERSRTDLQKPPPPAQQSSSPSAATNLTRIILDEAAMNLLQLGDPTYGGFGSAPKFPNAANVSFLLRYSKISGLSKFREFALKTLRKMAKGGIFDQIGGGFHRYSTDARWLVPHFEKMLYDNALIPVNYAEAYQITKDPFYLDVMCKTLDFVLREMTGPEGGFYSAFDADSDGAEGKFYVWSKDEIRKVIASNDTSDNGKDGGRNADLFCLYFDVTDGGNWEGNNILCNNINLSAVAFKSGTTEPEAKKIIDSCSETLLQHRQATKIKPGLDDKVLVSWNSLMITAFAKGYRVSGDGKYRDAARTCVAFIEKNLLTHHVREDDCRDSNGKDDGNEASSKSCGEHGNSSDGDQRPLLLHTYKNGTAKIDGYLEDYSYFTNALLDVFEIDPEPKYLRLALKLGRYMVNHFWDPHNKCFFMTSDQHEELIIRPKSSYDLSMPSGNSVAALTMIRLHCLANEQRFADIGTDILESHAELAAENPFGFGHLLNTAAQYMYGPIEVTVINQENAELCRLLCTGYLPDAILVMISDKAQLDGLSEYAFFAGKEFETKTSVFVCKDSVCSLPMYTQDEIVQQLGHF